MDRSMRKSLFVEVRIPPNSRKTIFVYHQQFDEQCFDQNRNGAFLLKYGAVPTLNLSPGSDMSCQSHVNMKPAAYEALEKVACSLHT